MITTRFGLDCEEFNYYFAKQVSGISPQAKESLPKDVLYKLRGGGTRLSFFGKLYILWRCLKKRWWLVVEDEDGGMSLEEFVELRKAIQKRDYGIPKANGFSSTGTFITANKDLCQTFNYLNNLSTSPAYNYLTKAKNKLVNKSVEWKEQMTYIVRMFAFYESNKKRWVTEMGLGIPEYLVLIYCYHGKEVLGSIMYREFYKRAYQSSPRKIKVAFGTLQHRGYLKKTGEGRGAKMQITPLGIEVINSIITKYALNC